MCIRDRPSTLRKSHCTGKAYILAVISKIGQQFDCRCHCEEAWAKDSTWSVESGRKQVGDKRMCRFEAGFERYSLG